MTRILAVVMAATVIAGEVAEPIDVYNDIDVSEGGVYPFPVRIHRERLHRWATDPDYDTIADDIGGKKPVSLEKMHDQLNIAYELYRKGEIDGMIFHCTPLVNKNLAAVEYARRWLAAHGDEIRPPTGDRAAK